MAAHLYYDRASSIMSDAEYDALSEHVADLIEYERLVGPCGVESIRLWQLGDPEKVGASGMGFLLTQATTDAAEVWHTHRLSVPPMVPYIFTAEDYSIAFGVGFCPVRG